MYDDIDFTIPAGVKEEAQRGLDWRREHGRGGTDVGVATARTLVSEERVSPEKARHVAAYFPRHEVDKEAPGFKPGEPGFPSAGRIAWALWGGDPGQRWSAALVAQMDAEDDAREAPPSSLELRRGVRLSAADRGCIGSIILAAALLAAGEDPPTELRLFRRGLNRTKKGDFLFTARSAEEVIARWREAGVDIPFDYDHGMTTITNTPVNGKAAGWFALEARDDGLYAVDIRWTEAAAAAIRAKEWRYTSPWFRYDEKTREILEIINCALTNVPATHGAEPLVAASAIEDNTETNPMREKLIQMLGLQPTATDEEIYAALEAMQQKCMAYDEMKREAGLNAQQAANALGALAATRKDVDALSSKVTELQQRIDTDRENAKRAELLSGAVRDGKITPAQRAYWERRSAKDLEEYLSTAVPVLPPAGQGAAPGGPAPAGQGAAALSILTDDDREVAAKLNLTLEEMAATKAELLKRGGTAAA